MRRREKATLLGEILGAVAQAEEDGERRLTRLAVRVNMPYDRFMEFIAELRVKGLVEEDREPRLTPRGFEVLRKFRGWKEVLAPLGFDLRSPRNPQQA